MTDDAGDLDIEKLKELSLPDATGWPHRYREASQQLPFPLGHLLLGVYRQRLHSPAAFVSCLTWFFEAVYRFLLALVLRPLILKGNLDGRIWKFFSHLLSLPDGEGRSLSLGAWKDFFFECFSRVLEDADARKQIPGFLRDYSDFPDRLSRLRDLYSAFVHFRNRLEHGVRDGNIVAFHQREADLYERTLVRLLLDFEALTQCGLVLFEPARGGLLCAAEVTPQGDTVPRPDLALPSATIFAQGREPVQWEAFLVKWSPSRDRALEAWSMHPFLTFSQQSGGRLDAWLFRQYVPSPEPAVLFDPVIADQAGGSRTEGLKATDPELVALLQRLVQIFVSRHTKSRAQPEGTPLGLVQRRVREEQERERRALIEEKQREAERRRRVHLDRIPYPRDPLFRGRQKDIEDVVAALRARHSLQVQSYLFGMGGVGKTALAVEICYRLIEEQVFEDGVLWYRVRIEEAEDVVRECARALKLGPKLDQRGGTGQVEAFRDLIRDMDMLVVMDNADYPLEALRPLFDLFQGVPLLITSRNELDLPGALTIRLGGMEPVDAVNLVKAVLGHRNRNDMEAWRRYGKESEIVTLSRTMGYLPLALKLSAFYMLQQRLTVRDYLERWHTQRDRFGLLHARLPEKEARLRDVRVCFALSFDTLTTQAQRLLMHLGQWEGRELSLRHLYQTSDEVIHPSVTRHDGVISALAEATEYPAVFTGGDDGRVLLWRRQTASAPPETVLRMGAAIMAILAPEGNQPLVAVDADGTVAIVSYDHLPARIGKASWLHLKGPWRLVRLTDGAPAIEVVAGRHVALVPLDGEVAEVRWLYEVEACKSAGNLSAELRAWIEQTGHQWLTAALPTIQSGPPPKGWLAGLAEAEDQVTESRPIARTDRDWVFVQIEPPKAATSSEEAGLKDLLVRQLVGSSLAEDRITDNSELRLRLHPLVSEFALQLLPLERRQEGRRKVQSFYIKGFGRDPALLDTDEQNVVAACIWMVDNAPPDELIAGDITDVCDKLADRCRWPLLRQLYEVRLAAARSAKDTDAVATLGARLALHLERMGRYSEALPLLRKAIEELWTSTEHAPLHRRPPNVLIDCVRDIPDSYGRQSRRELQEWLRRLRKKGCDDSDFASRFIEELHGPAQAAFYTRLSETTEVEMWKLIYRMRAAEWSQIDEQLAAERAVIEHAVRIRNEWLLAYTLSGHIETLMAKGELESARRCLADYRSLSELRDKHDALALADQYEARLHLREGRLAEAEPYRKRALSFCPTTEEGVAPVWWENHIFLSVAARDWNGVAEWLTAARQGWDQIPPMKRWLYHAASACWLLAQSRPELARQAWAHAEAYNEYGVPSSLELREPDLFEPAQQLSVSDGEKAEARQVVWGSAGAPRVMVQPPEFQVKPPRFLLPAHLRWHAITVGEVRAFCVDDPTRRLPWYYREVRPDALDEEPAQFLDYSLAASIAEWLGEELPAAARWRGLPHHEAWRPQPPQRENEQEAPTDDGSIDEWAEDQSLFQQVSFALLNPLTPEARSFGRLVLLSDALTPLDKWWVLGRLCDGGTAALDRRTRRLLEIALPRSVPDARMIDLQQRLLLDWRSLAFLGGLMDAPLRLLWLRPEFVARRKTIGALPGLSVVGNLRAVSEPRGMLLVPARCAWADVLGWPSTNLDPSPYSEETPPWP